mgnify:CR=1 FL=1
MIEIEQGTGKYVTIAADEETALRWSGDIGFKMMQYNQIRGVLPISQQYIDERLHVYYEVNKMQTLESMYAEAGLSVDKALKILLSLLQTVQGAEQYFLSAEQFVLNEQMVFLSRDNSRIWLCYHPDHDVEIAEGVRAVMEFLMKRILHSNRTATASFYGLYDMVCERRCTMAELAEQRRAKQPLQYPSAGSTFKRPEGYFAGKLVQDAGLKGKTIGGAQVSEKHSGFLINIGGATAQDILDLIAFCQKEVKDKFGVTLETEVKIVGEE